MKTNKFGQKLTLEQVRFVRLNWKVQKRKFWRELAVKWGVLPITLRRIGEGKTWRDSYVDKTGSDSKPCLVCGNYFFQRIDGKPRKSDARFSRQRFCSFACSAKHRWQSGLYANTDFRPKERTVCSERETDLGASSGDSSAEGASVDE